MSHKTMSKFYLNGIGPDHKESNDLRNTNDQFTCAAEPVASPCPSLRRFLCGILLVDERFCNEAFHGKKPSEYHLNHNVTGFALAPAPIVRPDYKNSILLGSIVLERIHLQQSLDRLRPALIEQIKSLPDNFSFLSLSGWTIERSQETKISVSSVFNDHNFAIAIKKHFDKPRIGVVNSNGDSIGFVFCNLEQSLLSLRVTIDDLLREALSTGSSVRVDFRFVDRHGWPVLPNQERCLGVTDVLLNQSVCIRPRLLEVNQTQNQESCIQTEELFSLSATASYLALPEPEAKLSIDCATPEDDPDWKRKSKKGVGLIRRNTSILRRNKDKSSKKQSRAKPIMLSYVRNEAANHAIQIKLELVALGFSVYLDVHEIQNGSDWQDALNEAVTNCDVFVPLITPMYGKTQWTNREIKLADLLKKTIIPVNFLEQWPPECLAIQFATTQYIPWRPIEGEEPTLNLKDLDIRNWPQKYVKRVCKLVAEQVPKPQVAINISRKSSSQQVLSPITPVVPFTPITPAIDTYGQTMQTFTTNGINTNVDVFPGPGQSFKGINVYNCPLVVIDAHPQQRRLAKEIQKMLEKDQFQVWCSCDFQSDSGVEMDSMDSGESDANLSTIVECNEQAHGTSGRNTMESMPSPDISQQAYIEKNLSQNLMATKLDIPSANKNHSASPARSRNSTPNRSPQQSTENLTGEVATKQPETEANATIKVIGKDTCSVECNTGAETSANHNTKKHVTHRRPTSLPVGNSEVPAIGERKRISRLLSHLSDTPQLNSLTPEKMERLKQFQDKVTAAEVVVVLVSSAYFGSSTSQKHAYYCEHRKKMVLLRVDDSKVSPWFANLLGEDINLCVTNPRYMELLRNRVKPKSDGGLVTSLSRDIAESKIQYLSSYMKKNMPIIDTCVYVIGSTKLKCTRSIKICEAIGQELAKLRNVTVVTSGFYGAGDLVARSFEDARKQRFIIEPATTPHTPVVQSPDPSTPGSKMAEMNGSAYRSQVVHILPIKEQKDFSDRCSQNADGTFNTRDYGKTLFLGECMKERETVVARVLNTCIMIEGGPGTASEAEEFIWNDSYVIPVISTGGAASGQFGVPMKIFECPPGVNAQDWQMLSDTHVLPEDVARSVVRILVHLKQNIAACAKFYQMEQIGATNGSMTINNSIKSKKSLRKKRLSDKFDQNSRTPSIASLHLEAINVTSNYKTSVVSSIGTEMLPVMQACNSSRSKSSKWWKVQKILPFATKKSSIQ